jgi:hypothetical protein
MDLAEVRRQLNVEEPDYRALARSLGIEAAPHLRALVAGGNQFRGRACGGHAHDRMGAASGQSQRLSRSRERLESDPLTHPHRLGLEEDAAPARHVAI